METRSQLLSKALVACDAGDVINAQRACSLYQEKFGEDADFLYLLGRTYLNLGQYPQATKLLQQSLEKHYSPNSLAYLIIAGGAAFNHFLLKTLSCRLDVEAIENYDLLLKVGKSYQKVRLWSQALDLFEQINCRYPNDADGFYFAGLMHLKLGQTKSAVQKLLTAIKVKEDHYLAHYALTQVEQHLIPESEEALLRSLLADKNATDSEEAKLYLTCALVRYLESRGELKDAADTLKETKQPFYASAQKIEAQTAAVFDWLLETRSETVSSDSINQQCQPIFVVGMPHSGVEIVAEALQTHPQVAPALSVNSFAQAVGELTGIRTEKSIELPSLIKAESINHEQLGERYLALTRGWRDNQHTHFIDAHPFNFFYISLIRRALPNAKFICLVRDPVDACVNNYTRPVEQYLHAMAYSQDIVLTARYYRHYYQLVTQLKQRFGEVIYQQPYEQLINDHSNQTKRLFDFCGLDYQQADRQKINAIQHSAEMQATGDGYRYEEFARQVNAKLADITYPFNVRSTS